MRTLTYEEVLGAVRAVVAKDPDRVYHPPQKNHCANVWEGQPSCVVGHAAPLLGIDVAWMTDNAPDNEASDLIDLAERAELIRWASEEDRAMSLSLMLTTQQQQDTEVETWAKCLEGAEQWVNAGHWREYMEGWEDDDV